MKDTAMLGEIQRRAIKMKTALRQLSCEDRLKHCKLSTLDTRRIRGDQIKVFKIRRGFKVN